MSGPASAAALAAGTGGGSWPMPGRRAASMALNVFIAASVLAAGTSLVGAGLAWAPSRDAVRAISRGARLYAAECAACHGGRLEDWDVRAGKDVRGSRAAPPLGPSGHAWQHSDAELAAIVGQGIAGGMPAFTGRLDSSEIEAVLTYVRSGWPRSARTYQAALSRGGQAWAALLRDPDFVFPGQCLPAPDAAEGR